MHSWESLPPFDGVLTVLAAAQAGSFSAAAEDLGLSHGAVSRRVQAVERWLGAALFERHGRGVRLTPAGQRFAATAEQAFSSIVQTAERWRPRRGAEAVRLSVLPSMARLWLLPRLGRIEEAAGVHVELVIEHRLGDLAGGGADVALRYGPGEWPGLKARLLFEERLFPAAAPDLAARLRGGDLASAPLLHDSDTSQWRAWLAAEGRAYRPRARDRRFEDYDLVVAAAEAGLGVALARSPLIEERLAAGRLVRLADREIRNPWSHHVVTRADEDRPSVLALAEELLNEAREGWSPPAALGKVIA